MYAEISILGTLKIMPRNINAMYVHEFGFCILVGKEDLSIVMYEYIVVSFTHLCYTVHSLYVIPVFVSEIQLPSLH